MTSFCLQIIRILHGRKLYLIFGRLHFWETFQLSRIDAINIVSSTDVTFRKAFQFEGKVVDLLPFGNVVNLVYFLIRFCNQNDVISQLYKLVDNSKMKQSITKISMTFFIVQQCYSSASIKIFASDHL